MTPTGPSEHLLVLPARTDVAALARAWFVEATWLREPHAAPERRAAVGARFRGMAVESVPEPGLLRLTWAARLEGPLDAETLAALGAPSSARFPRAGYRLQVEPAAPYDDRLVAWLRAAARRAGGSVVIGTGPVEVGDPGLTVDLAVFSASPLPPEAALGLARSVVPGARVESEPTPDEGIAPYTIVLPTQFDGAVELRFGRAAELPVSLLQLDWRDYGPFAYRAAWQPPAELGARPDAQLARIARERARPLVSRAAVVVAKSAGGVIVDGDGFVLPLEEVVTRAVAF